LLNTNDHAELLDYNFKQLDFFGGRQLQCYYYFLSFPVRYAKRTDYPESNRLNFWNAGFKQVLLLDQFGRIAQKVGDFKLAVQYLEESLSIQLHFDEQYFRYKINQFTLINYLFCLKQFDVLKYYQSLAHFKGKYTNIPYDEMIQKLQNGHPLTAFRPLKKVDVSCSFFSLAMPKNNPEKTYLYD